MVVFAAPLWFERAALRPARTPVVRTGMGPARSRRSGARLAGAAVLVAGVAGGLAPGIGVGDVVVASEVRGPDGLVVGCRGAEALADELRAAGLTVHRGPICSTVRLVDGGGRARLAATGALAVDLESVWLAPADGSAFAVVRAISDTATRPLLRPTVLGNGLAALRALRRAVPALDAWAERYGSGHEGAARDGR